MKNMILTAAMVLVAQSSFAGILNVKKGNVVKNDVKISVSATAQVNGQAVELTTVGSGVRKREILAGLGIIPAYVVEVLVSEPARFSKKADHALESLSDIQVAALQVTALRSLTIAQLDSGFRAAFKANGIEARNDADVSAFLNALAQGGDATAFSTLTILLAKNADGSEVLTFESPKGKVSSAKGAKGFTKKIFSMILGTPVDAQVAELKAEVLK